MYNFFKIKRHILVLVYVLPLLISACQKKEQVKKATEGKIVLKLMHSPETESFLKKAVEAFNAQRKTIVDGRVIEIKLLKNSGKQSLENLADGSVKPHLWLAQGGSFVRWVNSHLVNLGAKQDKCLSLFATPLVFASNQFLGQQLNVVNNEFSWKEFFLSKLQGGEGKFSLLSLDPIESNIGMASFIQQAYLASNVNIKVLDSLSLSDSFMLHRLKNIQKAVSGYAEDISYILKRISIDSVTNYNIALLTEQSVVKYNQSNKGKRLISLYYPKEGTFWLDYQLCQSNADWILPAHHSAIKIIRSFLSGKKMQFLAKQFGFRPSNIDFASVPPLTKEFGANVKLPSKTYPFISGNVLDKLYKIWIEVKKPQVLLSVIDASGSMDEPSLQATKDLIRTLAVVKASSPEDLKGLIAISTSPKMLIKPVKATNKFISSLDLVRAIGGSAVYDSIALAFNTIVDEEYYPYRKIVLVITDGGDKNSLMSFNLLKEIVSSKVKAFHVLLMVVAIERPNTSYNDLQELAQVANGFFWKVNVKELSKVFFSIKKAF